MLFCLLNNFPVSLGIIYALCLFGAGNNDNVPSSKPFDQIFKSRDTILIIGTASAPLFSPGTIYVKGHNIYLSDALGHKVFVFGKDGHLRRVLGQTKGRGPGEFQTPEAIVVDDRGYVYVNDRGNARIQIFRPDFRFLKSLQVGTIEQILVKESGERARILCVNVVPIPCGGEKAANARCLLQEFDWNGKPIRSFGVYRKPIAMYSWVAAMDVQGKIYVANVLDSEIEVFGADGTLERINRLSSVKSRVQQEPKTMAELQAFLKSLKQEKHTKLKTIRVRDKNVYVCYASIEKGQEVQHLLDIFDSEGRAQQLGVKAPGNLLQSNDDFFYFLTAYRPADYGEIEIRSYALVE
jgi:hypothetical protein